MFLRILGILFSPVKEWTKIANEERSAQRLFCIYVLPFLAITFACVIVGDALTKWRNVDIGIAHGIVVLLFALVTLFAIVCITNFIAPKCGGRRDWNRSFALATYSMTPMWLAGVLYSIPDYGALLYCIVSLYGFYILCRGVRPMQSIPKDTTVIYCILPVVIWVIASAIGVIFFRYALMLFFLEMFAPQAADTFRAGVLI
ncbi:MAG: YIP1 family protein [Spirochaetota bacterium]|jgi:hypothetical protein|nr:YIP1 family protein [Spirochaetota bacterium]